jgi:uroporphyrinogen-III synthase
VRCNKIKEIIITITSPAGLDQIFGTIHADGKIARRAMTIAARGVTTAADREAPAKW